MALRDVPVGALIEDLSFYSRRQVNDYHISAIKFALKGGMQLPPIIVERGTLRLVDGFHRSRAYKSLYGADHPVTVEEREYETEIEFWNDVVETDNSHGLALSPADRVRIIVRSRELGMPEDQIRTLIKVDETRYDELAKRLATSEATGEPVPVKYVHARELSGRTINEAEEAANASATGQKVRGIILNLNRQFRAGLVPSDPNTGAVLRELEEHLNEYDWPEDPEVEEAEEA